MPIKQFIKTLAGSLLYACLSQCLIVAAFFHWVFVGAVKTSDVGDDNHCLAHILQLQLIAVHHSHPAVFRFHSHDGAEVYASVAVILMTALSLRVTRTTCPCGITVDSHPCHSVALRLGSNMMCQLTMIAQTLVQLLAICRPQAHNDN